MSNRTALVLLAFALCAPTAPGQQAATVEYIHRAWPTLTRSMSDCRSFTDVKVAGASILYLPAATPTAPLAQALSHCRVEIRPLPQPIRQIGDFDAARLSSPGLLYLPHPYVVPGGMFNEMYGWDSYFIIRGLLLDGKRELARDMVENFFFEIDNYGGVLNANRTYYLTRSQPPFLTSMIRAVYDSGGFDQAWLARAYAYAVRDHGYWMRPEHQAGKTGLARYYDYGSGPVPEMRGDDNYYAIVALYAVLHPDARSYLAPPAAAASSKGLLLRACRADAPAVCSSPETVSLTDDYYQGDRAMRESGFDPSFRFGPYSGRTHHFAPVGLNALLYKSERDLAWMAAQLGDAPGAARWSRAAEERKAKIDQYLWNGERGAYFDYDFERARRSEYLYATTSYPLWAGAASPLQASAVERTLRQLTRPGGIEMSAFRSGTQWDAPYGWAPLQLITVEGLRAYGFSADADSLARNFDSMVDENLGRDGSIREKYDVETRSTVTTVNAGYKQNVVGFGWTNGVYLVLRALRQKP